MIRKELSGNIVSKSDGIYIKRLTYLPDAIRRLEMRVFILRARRFNLLKK